MVVSWSGGFLGGFWEGDLGWFSMACRVDSGEITARGLNTEGEEEEESFTGEDENWIM